MLTTDVCVSSGGRLRRMESGEREWYRVKERESDI